MVTMAKMAALILALLAMATICAPPVSAAAPTHKAACHGEQDAPPPDHQGPARTCCIVGCSLAADDARTPLIVPPATASPLPIAMAATPLAGRAPALDPPPPRQTA